MSIVGKWRISDVRNAAGESISDKVQMMIGMVYDFKPNGLLAITFTNGARSKGVYSILSEDQREFISFDPLAEKEKRELVRIAHNTFEIISQELTLEFVKK